MFELTGFQRDLLYVAASLDRPSGQDLMEELSVHLGSVNHGRLYPNLDLLAEAGYVEKGQKNRRTNYYEVTEEGRELIRERRRWENSLVHVDPDSGEE
jgi:DNA-binding PadR family transcriptional regulator